jgi:hypothetical protein
MWKTVSAAPRALSGEAGPHCLPQHHNDSTRVNLNRESHGTAGAFQLAGLSLLVEDHALGTYAEGVERDRRRVAPKGRPNRAAGV